MHQNKNQNKKEHQPVLIDEVIKQLSPKKGDSYLDLTAGYGGHAQAVVGLTGKPDLAVLVDRDQSTLAGLKKLFSPVNPEVLNMDFLTASQQLLFKGKKFDLILADLGVSSPHLNEDKRGFSFQLDGPLDMRMDQRLELTAEKVVNSYSRDELVSILKNYGEEPKAYQIADRIIARRPLLTTSELAIIASAAWKGSSRVHPATRTFQAVRIEVNNELGLLKESLPLWHDLLKEGGRIAVISFHSLEDRIVKQFLNEHSGNNYDSTLQLLNKHPIVANQDEIANNPRARSAKLRAAVKINTKRKGATNADTG
jgi:16S rRNA (cytosine1402-N4)-methyltransferase